MSLKILIPKGKLVTPAGTTLRLEQHGAADEIRTAIFSNEYGEPDHRYVLQIVWDESLPLLVGLCLNPSTATHLVNDPTVERMCRRARMGGFGGFVMLNIFAFRATEPEDMKAADDPVGPHNDEILASWFKAAVDRGWTVMAGWGNHGTFQNRYRKVLELAATAGLKLQCLAISKALQPVHPLYQPYATPFIPYDPA